MRGLPANAVALVTGGARRLGRATALRLADEGVGVVVHYHRSQDEAESLRLELTNRGVPAWAIKADLADPAQAGSLPLRAAEAAGRLDILVNNASTYPAATLETLQLEELTESIGVNAWAPFSLCRAFACSASAGRIVNMLDARLRGYDFAHPAYILSKHLLCHMTRMLAMQLAPAFTVNAVAPGLVMPPVDNERLDIARLAGALPLQKAGTPDDVVEAVWFLLSSPFVTGQVVFVDGGRHLREPEG